MKKFAFNGFLFSQRQTGTMRYAREILLEMDHLVHPDELSLVVPKYAEHVPNLKTIKVVKFGKTKGSLWEQIDYPRYLKKTGQEGFGFNNTFPLLCPGMLVIYDIAYKLHGKYYKTIHDKISKMYHRLIFFISAKKQFPIVTVSYFTKYQLIDYYHIDPRRITVIGSAWQHFKRIEENQRILESLHIDSGNYYFTLGSIVGLKNTKWILEIAKKNPLDIFVITGKKDLAVKKLFDLPLNVIYTDYISDGEIKSLMKNCKAFIFPSIYEGFGLPPLEALSQGAQVICSNAASLPEIYGSSVHYIDPYDTKVNLDKLLSEPVGQPDIVLNKFSWRKSAEKLYTLLMEQD